MKRKNLLAILMTGMVLGIGTTGCSAGTTGALEGADKIEENADEAGDTDTASASTVANSSIDTTTIGAVTSVSQLDLENMFTSRDVDTGYDESSSAKITLNGDEVSVSGNGVAADGCVITISSEGTYIFEGTLNDGQIVVAAGDSNKVQIVLNGVTITNDDGPCIYVQSADKVFVTLADDSENTLSDTGAEYVQSDDSSNVDGVIFSKDDITFNGAGTLTVNAGYANGIVGKDDVKFTGGTINVTATGNAIEGKDSVRIKNGSFNLVAGNDKDGIHSSNAEEEGKGYIYIEGGDFNIAAKDDGIHAETVLYICGGNINVTESYEGLEGDTVDILGGTINVVSSDDGINASSNTAQDESGFGNMGFMGNDENAYIHIYGGTINIDASGDGIDSNGSLYVDGGEITVAGPTNDGNGPLDKGGDALISGGTVIAVGSSGMAETFGSDSEQYSVKYGFESTLSEGTEIVITDSNGEVLLDYTLTKDASCLVYSSEALTKGEYTITAGDFTDTITVSDDKSVSAGKETGMMGGPGGFPGGETGENGERPEFKEGEMPELPEGVEFKEGEMPQPPEGMEFKEGERPEFPGGDSSENSSN